MSTKKGIDVSHNNGVIDWDQVKANIDFAMIRAGYGRYTVDSQFEANCTACEELSIPYGVYWFSYATSEDVAKEEAAKCLETIKGKSLSYPVAYDFEEASMKYANKQGVTLTASETSAMANAFLKAVDDAGYQPLLYSDADNLIEYFPNITDYPIWLAKWGTAPTTYYPMWQYSATGAIDGIDGDVDLNYSYEDWSDSMTWEEIINDKTDSPDKWIAGINAVVEIASQDSDVADLEIMKYLPDLIEKIGQ